MPRIYTIIVLAAIAWGTVLISGWLLWSILA
jgi:hypothetical protein